MPLEDDDQKRVDDAITEAGIEGSSKLLVLNASESHKLGPVTVICMILNRTVGSGIYVSPAIVLKSTGSVGASLLLWSVGPVVAISALLCWLELGLSIPKFRVPNKDATELHHEGEGETKLENVPSSGGEKNYLEYIFKSPKVRTTCMYGVIYVTLGNLSGNAIAFGLYVMDAAGVAGNDSAGPVHGTTVDPNTHVPVSNFDIHTSFLQPSHDVANYANSLVFIMYTFSGYEQPFYVMSEIHRPKKTFAISTIVAVVFIAIINVLVNIAFLCAVSVNDRLYDSLDMATVFFRDVFGNDLAPRVMSGIIAFSIFGNIVVMTFTASRGMTQRAPTNCTLATSADLPALRKVKQEIAKEGVLPFSLFFASSSTTPYAYLKERLFPSKLPECQRTPPEQSPAAALFLHWIFCMLMIGASSSTAPDIAYTALVSIYSYVVVVLVRFFVATGLLYLRFSEGKSWLSSRGFKPWGGPTAALIYSSVFGFLLIAFFIPPAAGSPFTKQSRGIDWYIVPCIGLGFLVLGYIYYLCFAYLIPRIRKEILVVERQAVIVKEKGEWVQALEVVEAIWVARSESAGVPEHGISMGMKFELVERS
ncbi:MAG: hypothetical protein ALECFALPRED_005836 [Alectoria fallacina]|uniref:Amino acid transporter n=1 Tax=Alectoria fallacina TaxID=1903189 RepID=A0A8H3G0L4_9LECA|nr:MAG: hypothetical protein ALECFALPRED_005836 [Alectoria fallacina]